MADTGQLLQNCLELGIWEAAASQLEAIRRLIRKFEIERSIKHSIECSIWKGLSVLFFLKWRVGRAAAPQLNTNEQRYHERTTEPRRMVRVCIASSQLRCSFTVAL